uniref:Uncharacterized protein n=1 Tax=Panagrolaimus sp. ES5 TaxID=591445 RepID=A0AC34G3A9_9BILA
MENSSECCGKDIKTCAKVVAILGIVSSIVSFNIIGLIIYFLVYIGVEKERPGYLLPAKILLIIGVICTILLLIAGITVGIVFAIKMPDSTEIDSTQNPNPETKHKLNR